MLYLLAFIYNENLETFESIFNHLKINYNFYPELITIDLGRACYKAINKVFPSCRIFPCYFHIIRRFILHIGNLKSKNKVIKRNAEKLLLNMKLLSFIETTKLDEFYNLIKTIFIVIIKNFLFILKKPILIINPLKINNGTILIILILKLILKNIFILIIYVKV